MQSKDDPKTPDSKNASDGASNKTPGAQCVHRFVSNDFTLRASSVDATQVVRQMQILQKTFPIPTVAVGRAMVGALLLAGQLKEGQQVGLLFRGNGPLSQVYAEAHFEGQVRGYIPFPQFQPAEYTEGLSLKKHIGNGTLTVARHVPFQKQPFQGTVEMVSGEIGEDIAHYLIQSHQIRSLISVGVYLDINGIVQAAGGVMVEVMPGVEGDVVDLIQKNAEAQKTPISQQILEGTSAKDLIVPFLAGVPYTQLDHNYPISYSCPCTKERVLRALEILGINELGEMVAENENAQITCQMCGRPYEVTVPEIEELKEDLRKNSMH